LIGGRAAGEGDEASSLSPVGGTPIQRTRLLSDGERARLFASPVENTPLAPDELRAFCARLHAALCELSGPLHETLPLETGFTARDCAELSAASLDYVRDFPREVLGDVSAKGAAFCRYDVAGRVRTIRLARAPWGTVAVILPQNAFLLLALTCLLNALAEGNRVILRAPLGSARSAALLNVALRRCDVGWRVSVVLTSAKEFVAGLHASPEPGLLHYLGGTRHAASLLGGSFGAGKACLIDGEGNGWVWVGPDADLDAAAETLTVGATRYNGQTCTSVNGALVDPDVYDALRDRLVARWDALRCGDPLVDESVDVGPVFDEAQAAWCEERVRECGGTVLCGGARTGNLLAPTLAERPDPRSLLVREGLFGPALWVAPATADEFGARWRTNRFPLCAGVLSPSADPADWLPRLPNVARLSLNGDPSVEHLFEPWGGYGASGTNPVGAWRDKYARVVQVDAPAD
jgi:acyl-CoA reductase-like NAD-dependent aldehyde dehydrogenase